MTPAVAAVMDAGAWAVAGVAVGYAASRLPSRLLDHDTALTGLRSWERDGRAYVRLGVRRWKDRLPEAGAVFRGGISKRSLPGRDMVQLERFRAETRRAELVHWALLAVTPLFALWNPPLLLVAMVAYALVANVPCIIVQRYNRARLARILDGAVMVGR